MSMIKEPICTSCRHYDWETSTCAAFPDGIPDVIFEGDNKHSKPLPDQQNKIVFEPIDEDEK